jgi:hypothetical protein
MIASRETDESTRNGNSSLDWFCVALRRLRRHSIQLTYSCFSKNLTCNLLGFQSTECGKLFIRSDNLTPRVQIPLLLWIKRPYSRLFPCNCGHGRGGCVLAGARNANPAKEIGFDKIKGMRTPACKAQLIRTVPVL